MIFYLYDLFNVVDSFKGCCFSKIWNFFDVKSKNLLSIVQTKVNRNKYRVPLVLYKRDKKDVFLIDILNVHCLLAGGTDCGKTSFLFSYLIQLMFFNHPEYLNIAVLDGKYSGFPLFFKNVVTLKNNLKDICNFIRVYKEEAVSRSDFLKKNGFTSVISWNKEVYEKRRGKVIPYLFIVLDELEAILEDLETLGQKKELLKVKSSINYIVRTARAVGIYLLVSTQSPYVDSIAGKTKNNMENRFCGKMNHSQAGGTIIDFGEFDFKTLKQGEFALASTWKSLICSNIFLEDKEIKKIISKLVSFGSFEISLENEEKFLKKIRDIDKKEKAKKEKVSKKKKCNSNLLFKPVKGI